MKGLVRDSLRVVSCTSDMHTSLLIFCIFRSRIQSYCSSWISLMAWSKASNWISPHNLKRQYDRSFRTMIQSRKPKMENIQKKKILCIVDSRQ